jgi:receptor protein-tyrosine kinase
VRRSLRNGGVTAATSHRDEAFRVLRSNLDISLADLDRSSVMVTSPNPSEGKTLTSVNLAAAVARTGRRVVLVDIDLRHADVHNLLDMHNEYGVADLLLSRRPLSECLQYVNLPPGPAEGLGFYALAVGQRVENPAELLSTSRTARLIDNLTSQADLVVIDGPPVLPVADALALARVAGGVVVVVEAERTTFPDIRRTVDLLTRNQARLLGLVLNRANPRGADGYGYQYGTTAAGA